MVLGIHEEHRSSAHDEPIHHHHHHAHSHHFPHQHGHHVRWGMMANFQGGLGVPPGYRQLATTEPNTERLNDGDLESCSSKDSEPAEVRHQRRLAELKTTVFDTYAICAALLASFACSTTFISEHELLAEVAWRRYTVQIQQFLVRVCIIGGIHAMLVFMFCALYAKSALARENFGLEVYERFSKETGAVRMMAFWSMYYTAILYSVQIAMSCVYSLPWQIGLPTTVLMLCLIGRVVYDAQNIIKAAGCVFMPEEAVIALTEANKKKDEEEKALKALKG